MTMPTPDIGPSYDRDLIDDGHVDMDALKRSSVRGAAVNFGAQSFKFVIQFLYQIVIMRLLAPRDFGLVAMAAPIMAFVSMFADMGLSQAMVQRPHITHKQLNFLFWFSAGVSGALGLATIALAPVVGWFYGEPKVTPIVMALGVVLFVSGIQSQPSALLTRRMEFGKLAAINLVSLALGLGTGIAAALIGCGYWSLVITPTVSVFASLIPVWRAARWVPTRPQRAEGVRGMIGFGGNLTIFNTMNFFARNLDNILIGRVWGDVPLGFYDRAYKILLLPLTQIVWPLSAVVLPTLSRALHDPALYRRAFLRMFEAVLLFTYPGTLFAMCASQQIILIVFGARWLAVAPLFSVLAISGLFALASNAAAWLYPSQDRTREMRNWGAVSSAILVASFIIGLPWGVLGVAVSYSAFTLLQGPLCWWWATRRGPVALRDFLAAFAPHAYAGMAAMISVSALQEILPQGAGSLVLLFAASHIAYGGALACMPHGRRLFADLWAQARHLGLHKGEAP
ncbi:MAG: lipopolysaccharide biosynthesis protein [Alphaproteobacteria bacterium]|nr:lipopolysaccharide biosynthesis protein [Alphaproteobacteria bacterium]